MTLPVPKDESDLERLRVDLPPWRDGLRELAAQHGLSGEPTAEPSGTLPVFRFDGALLKLYLPAGFDSDEPASEAHPDYETERAVLVRLAESGSMPAPRVLGEGSSGAWRYLVMSEVEGRPLEGLIETVPHETSLAAMRTLGSAVSALHSIDAEALPSTVPDFEVFLSRQERTIVDVERRRGAPDAWLEPLARFVASTPRGAPGRSLLHTELGPSHVLCTVEPEGIVLRGVIDWVEAMRGDPEYDIAAVAFFIAKGDAARLGAFLDGYGWAGPRGRPLARRLMRYLLLHRYAPLSWLLARRPVPEARDFEDLLEPWIGLAP